MEKTKIGARILADSVSPQGDRLITLSVTMPRIILSEFNTHRMLSKNTASSRAIPFEKMVEVIKNDPFTPIAFQKSHKGMQGSEYLLGIEAEVAERNWLVARDKAVMMATHMNEGGVTKQLCNRLLEPFMWTTMIVTGSKEGWDNFFELRNPVYGDSAYGLDKCSITFKSKKEYCEYFNISEDYQTDLQWYGHNYGQAEIHMMMLSEKIYDTIQESTPRQLRENEWHIPNSDIITEDSVNSYLQGIMNIRKDGLWGNELIQQIKVKVATSMAARESYTVVGKDNESSLEKHLELFDKLVSYDPPHSSPMEHCARAMSDDEYVSFIKGSLDAEIDADGYVDISTHINNHNSFGWCRNFKGFIQLRHLIETNSYF